MAVVEERERRKSEGSIMFKRFFRNRSLKSRITFLYTLFAVAVVGAITLYAYYFAVNLLKKQEISILNDSIDYLEKSISARIRDINEEYINNFTNGQFLRMYLESMEPEQSLAQGIELNYEFMNYFADMKARNSDLVESIQLITSENKVYSDEYTPKLTGVQFAESSYYSACMDQKNRILYCNPEPEDDCFCILRSFYFLNDDEGGSAYPGVGYLSENDEDYSALIFFLKKKYLRKMIQEEAEKRQTSILILDQDGNAVIQEGDMDWLSGENNNGVLANRSGGEESEFFYEEAYDGGMELGRANIHIRTVDLMDWDIVYLYDMNHLYRQAGEIRNAAIIIFAFAFLAVFLIAAFISGTVVKPIHALAKSMDEAVENNMEVQFQPEYNDEIAGLGRKFCLLMQRISALMAEIKRVEQQKRAEELKALQAQINPHFLYNTLDMVYWLAKMNGSDDIADLIADLAGFFRLSLNKGEDITSVEREVEHVRKYLEIQKVRMDGKFEYEIEMQQEIREEKVPKLILQPFVENTLLHGFETITWKGKIRIDVRREGGNLVFYIEDNGSGISPELLQELNQTHGTADQKPGYAVGNVRDRITLYAGSQYGVRFDTETVCGTRVCIWFPCGFGISKDSEKNMEVQV